MKAIFLVIFLAHSFLTVFSAQAQLEVPFYPETDQQLKIYTSAIDAAYENKKPVIFILGRKTCVWCHSLGNLISSTELGRNIEALSTIQPINLTGDAQQVVDRLKSRAGLIEKIPGYPFIFVVDPMRDLTTAISLAEFEHNIPEQGIYTHHPELVLAGVFYGLGLPLGTIENNSINLCNEYLIGY